MSTFFVKKIVKMFFFKCLLQKTRFTINQGDNKNDSIKT